MSLISFFLLFYKDFFCIWKIHGGKNTAATLMDVVALCVNKGGILSEDKKHLLISKNQ